MQWEGHRLLALYQRLGDDDCFSSDLTDKELASILQPTGSSPCLVLLSGADQYVPPGLDAPLMAKRLTTAIGPSSRCQVIPGALHALDGMEEEAAGIIAGFVSSLS